jgi:hypothetical protein
VYQKAKPFPLVRLSELLAMREQLLLRLPLPLRLQSSKLHQHL